MKTIYLAGGAAEFEYRKYVKDKYGDKYNFIDPISDSDRLFKEIGYDMTVERIFDKTKDKVIIPYNVRESIVKNDKQHIVSSDVLIAYIQKPSFGTIMEIEYAFCNRIPVYVIIKNAVWLTDVWLSVHSDKICTNIDHCFYCLSDLWRK